MKTNLWPLLCAFWGTAVFGQTPSTIPGTGATVAVLEQPFRMVDLRVGEMAAVTLSDGNPVEVKLLNLRETRDSLRHAVRKVEVTVEVNGQKLVLSSAGYHLPVTVDRVQVDCPITKGCVQRGSNPWALDKDARLRLWPAGAPWIQPGTFRYLRDQLDRVRAIAARHRDAKSHGGRDLARIAQWLSDQWQGANNLIIEG